ncbi:MAG: MFS transporter [Gemmatimonadaceae bacterium]|nr:MFS transporter [Gemmatimonadaceae bacterium]
MVFASAVGAAAGVTGMSVYALSILIGPLTEAFGWSREQLGAAKTVATAGFMLTAPFVGILADRIGARPLAMGSLAALAAAMFWMTQIGPSVASFYLSFFALAVVGGATTPLVWTRAVATWFRDKRGLAMALTLSGPGVIGVVTPTLLDTLIERFDWRAAYVTMGCFAALALIPVGLWFRENRPATAASAAIATGASATAATTMAPITVGAAPTTRATPTTNGYTVGEALRTRWFWQIALAFVLVGAVVSALMVHLVPLMMDAGLGRTLAVRIAGVLGLSVIFGRLLTGWLVDRFHPPYVAAAFLIMPVFGCLLLTGETVTPLIVICAIAFIGLAAGSEVDLVPYLTARYFGLRAYGRIYSWMFIAFYAGVAVGPLLLGRIYDRDGHYDTGLLLAIPVLAAGVALVATLGRASVQASR